MASDPVAPFTLYCTICIEPFDLENRLPVVLPCGHTFLCEPCSKRLKTCMECRSPLYTTPPPTPPPVKVSPSYSPTSYRRTTGSPRFGPTPSARLRDSPPPPQPSSSKPEPIPLPIPKNLVLMSILEAAHHVVKSDDDEKQVHAGMDMVRSDYGTYVVRHREGLTVHTLPPILDVSDDNTAETADKASSEVGQDDEAADSGSETPAAESDDAAQPLEAEGTAPSSDDESVELRDPLGVEALPSNLTVEESPSDERTCCDQPVLSPVSSDEDAHPLRLRFGQTVQVVSFIDGVAKLARGRGYIVANSRQLAKIGDATDDACKLEGMISSVKSKQQELQRELNELEAVEYDLSLKLEEAILVPDENPFAMSPGFEDLECVTSSPETTLVPKRRQSDPLAGGGLPLTPDLSGVKSESAEFDNFVLSVTAAREVDERRQSLGTNREMIPSPPGSYQGSYYTCTTDIIPNILADDSPTASPLYDVRRPRSSSLRSHPVDFATGLSGHMALSSASTHVDRSKPIHRTIRMMGEHRGIANIRRVRSHSHGSTSSTLGNPSW